ncbi:MAG: PaaI family thioesterase [Pseudomonadota bacterium]|jgi:uncharacterized protein (TIGR00369 family)
MSDLVQMGRRVLASQPFSVLLGAQLTRLEPGIAEIRIPLRPELKQQHGFAHGGVISYAADNALTFAGGSMLGNCLTAEFKISYVRPSVGSELIARAHTVHAGRNQATCRCDVFVLREGAEMLTATALGTITKVPPAEQ